MNFPARFGTLPIALVVLLSACGGGDSSNASGTLVAVKPSLQHSASDVDRMMSGTSAAQLAGSAQCGVTVSHLTYMTRDPAGAPATATAALMVATGTGANCTGPRPVLLYSHGTTTLKSYNMADPEKTPEALLC